MTAETAALDALIKQRAAGVSNQAPTPAEIAAFSPLDVMQFAMIQAAVAGDWATAASYARDCAPYRHARLSTVDVSAALYREPREMSDAELMAIIQAGEPAQGD